MGSTRLDGQGFLEHLSVIEEINALELSAADFGGHFYNSDKGIFIFYGKITIPADTGKSKP